MKKITLLAVAFICAIAANAQTMQVKSGGSVVFESDVNSLDEVKFSDEAATTPMVYFKQPVLRLSWGDEVDLADILVCKNLVSDPTVLSFDPSIVDVENGKIVFKDFGVAIVEAQYRVNASSKITATLYVIAGSETYMYVEDVYSFESRGVVVTGKLAGKYPNDKIVSGQPAIWASILDDKGSQEFTVESIEMFRVERPSAVPGDQVGIFIGNQIPKADINRGDVIYVKNNLTLVHSKTIKGDMYVYTKEEGGRHTPFTVNYRPQAVFGPVDMTVLVTDLGTIDGEVPTLIMPGSSAKDVVLTIDMDDSDNYTPYFYVGQDVMLKEGGKTVARLTVTGY